MRKLRENTMFSTLKGPQEIQACARESHILPLLSYMRIKKPTEKEVSELVCYKSITQTNKKTEFSFEKFCNKTEDRSRRLWFLWKQLILVPKQNSLGKCQVPTHQCEVWGQDFPCSFPWNSTPSQKSCYRTNICSLRKSSPATVARPSSWTDPTGLFATSDDESLILGYIMGNSMFRACNHYPCDPDYKISLCTTTHICGWKSRNAQYKVLSNEHRMK